MESDKVLWLARELGFGQYCEYWTYPDNHVMFDLPDFENSFDVLVKWAFPELLDKFNASHNSISYLVFDLKYTCAIVLYGTENHLRNEFHTGTGEGNTYAEAAFEAVLQLLGYRG